MTKNAWWIGNRVLDGQVLLGEFDSVFAAGLDFGILEEQLFPGCYSPERSSLVRNPWVSNPAAVLWPTREGKELFERLTQLQEPTALITYAPNEALERATQHNSNLKLATNPMELHLRVDSKLFLINQLNDLCPESFLQSLSNLDFSTIVARLGLPFIIQLSSSIGGDGTFRIDNRETFETTLDSLKDKGSNLTARIMKFITGPSFNTNGVILNTCGSQTEVIVAAPSVQLVGLPDCTGKNTKYCGNDFSAVRQYPESLVKRILTITEKIGKVLGGLGYRGIFGLDLIYDGQQLFLLEINPRFQGSTPLLHRLELAQKFIPLIHYHLAAFNLVAAPTMKDITKANARALSQLEGCQLYLYNIKPIPVEAKLKQISKRLEIPLRLDLGADIQLDLALPEQPVIVAPEIALTRAYSYNKNFSSLNPDFNDCCHRIRSEIDRLLIN